MSGTTDLELIGKKPTNLFFFGNFYKLPLEEYKKGLSKVFSENEILDDTMMTDLYYLGKVLGAKYKLVRNSYRVFMYGILATVITYVIVFIIDGFLLV